MKTLRIAQEVLALAKEVVGFEFPSKELMEDYLKQHPKADRSKHWVKNQKPEKEPKKEESPAKSGEKTVDSTTGKFQIPEHKSLKYEADGGLGNVAKWKAKIVLGNSMTKDKKVGDMDEVGYVAINPRTNDLVPIARSDEHQAGHEFLFHLEKKGILRGREQDYITLFNGNNYPHYATNDTRAYASAVKKWLAYGGPNCCVHAVKEGPKGGEYITDMQEYADLDGQVPYGSKQPSKAGKDILDSLEGTMAAIKSGDKKAAFDGADKVLERLYMFRMTAIDSMEALESAQDKAKTAKEDGDLDALRRAMGIVLKDMQKAMSPEYDYAKKRVQGLFGSSEEAQKRVEKLAGEPDGKSSKEGMSLAGQSTVDALEIAARASLKDFGGRSMIRSAEELIRQLRGLEIEGLKQALENLERAVVVEKDEDVKQALFSYNGVKNLLHNWLRALDKEGVAKDKHFGNVKSGLAEFDRLGQI